MFDYFTGLFTDSPDLYGTSPGITYTPDAPTFQPSDYASLNAPDAPIDAGFRDRTPIDWNSPSALHPSAGMGSDATGAGLQFSDRPAEALYQAPADVQAQSIKNLARGGSNIPTQLGSNTPDKTGAGLNYSGLAKAGLLGAAMYASTQGGQSQRAPQRLAAPMGGEGWGATYRPVTFQGLGAFGNASPYTNPTLTKGRNIREELARRMQYQRGLLG